MKKMIFCIASILIAVVSCKKKETPDPVPPPPLKFMSVSAGSTWNYELINKAIPSTTLYTLTSTNRDSVVNAKSYHVFTNSGNTGNEYYNITANDYFNFRKLPAAVGGSIVEYNYLKDNAAVGTSWSQAFAATVSGFATNTTINNTISEKGITKIVKGITYTNVIHVTTTLSVAVAGVTLPPSAVITDIHTYYAERVGVIEANNKININFGGVVENTDQQTNLISADIK